MQHRAAVITATCSVLAHVGTHRTPAAGARMVWPATIHAQLVAARMDSQAVVYGSNGQPLRRVILTW